MTTSPTATLDHALPQRLEGRLVTAGAEWNNAAITVDEAGVATAVEQLPGHGEITWVPGFSDLHNHGGNAGAFPSGTTDDCRRAALYHRTHGTTTLLASLVSATGDELARQAERLKPLVAEGLIDGIHMEGPFINPGKCGAQNPAKVMPGNPALFSRVIDASDNTVRAITFAPETEHADELLRLCADHGIIASLGHTNADYATTHAVITRAVELGVTVTATHLFNAMPRVLATAAISSADSVSRLPPGSPGSPPPMARPAASPEVLPPCLHNSRALPGAIACQKQWLLPPAMHAPYSANRGWTTPPTSSGSPSN